VNFAPAGDVHLGRYEQIIIAQEVRDDRDALCPRRAKQLSHVTRTVGIDAVDHPRDLSDDAAARPSRNDSNVPIVVRHRDADRIAVRVRYRRETDRDLLRATPFVSRRHRKRHRWRAVENNGRRQDGAIGRKADVRAIAAREQTPIDAARIVALAIETIFGEFGGRPALLRLMRSGNG
jgi:hypothetical protein